MWPWPGPLGVAPFYPETDVGDGFRGSPFSKQEHPGFAHRRRPPQRRPRLHGDGLHVTEGLMDGPSCDREDQEGPPHRMGAGGLQ